MSIRVGNVFDYNNNPYRIIYFRFDSHVKTFSPTNLTIKLNQNTFKQRYVIPIRAAYNYDPLYKGLTDIENPVGEIVSLDLGSGAQEDHRIITTHYDFST